ncbi:MFS transporter [Snodgrassella sp. CFCC 13594]|uniref:MFS transporter n=1 Tax=Snodgrassella sp. CFCC 13594 TaxID=1775559 RepID=UPI000829B4AF|nr:MFS transporter [Snodgrassella sp. CFCC 13594]
MDTPNAVVSNLNTAHAEQLNRVYKKISWRLLPLLLLCYFFSYLDRINIGFAKLQMQQDLGFSDAVYGMAAGIFFLGYVMFEIPSNLLLEKIGARKTITRIMVLWGLASASMLFVTSPTMFYVLRFLLGVFEAGFAPGMIFFLTYWYSGARMARVMAIVMMAAPLGGMLGSPLSTHIMTLFDGTHGLAGWQWVFLIEGIPTVVLGMVTFFYLTDHPNQAKWLTESEKQLIRQEIQVHQTTTHTGFKTVLKDPWIYCMAFAYLTIISGIYAIGFWFPTLLKNSGIHDLNTVGWLTSIPYLVSIVFMLVFAKTSDAMQERKWHGSLTALGAGVLLLVSVSFTTHFWAAFVSIVLATGLMWAAYTIFWAIPSRYLTDTAAAGGIALINSIGLIGGFISPNIMGMAQSMTQSLMAGWIVMAILLALGGLALLGAFALKQEVKS